MKSAITLLILVISTWVTSTSPAANLQIRLQPRWLEDPIAVPSDYLRHPLGQTLRITRLSALVSNVRLMRNDGRLVLLDGQFGFLDLAHNRDTITLHRVPEGEYVGIEFQIGLNPETNHADPETWPSEHPLNPLVNRLHWGWQGGYVFLALEGRWSRDQKGAERGFSYHLATDEHVMPLRFVAQFEVREHTTVDVAFDVGRVLKTVELVEEGTHESTHSMEGDALATALASATKRSWFWLGSAPTESGAVDAASDATPYYAESTTPVPFTSPAGFPQPSLPADNPLIEEGIALGETLFFDKRLSSNNTQSCAGCHTPDAAFSDTVALSTGAEGIQGTRNAMPLLNLAWNPGFAWDGSQPRIRDQALAAWMNPIEMNADPEAAIAEISHDPEIREQFSNAFGDDTVTAERITLALEQYLLTHISSDSKFDQAMRGEVGLSPEELRGFELFNSEYDPGRGRYGADCFHCHGGQLFSDFGYRNNGLKIDATDTGRAIVSGKVEDKGKFKTPSLRNIEVTAPYMHDGSVNTLEEVIVHYSSGVERTRTLDPNLAKHPTGGINLSEGDQAALVAFLRTLTDVRYLQHP